MAALDISLATAADEAELRRILRQNALPGRIAVTFEREPNFFIAAGVEGPFHQTVLLRDGPGGQIVGMVTRSVRQVYINGAPAPLGYYSQMRLIPGYRLIPQTLSRVADLLHELDADRRTRLYLVSIIADNRPARRLLTARRPGFPHLYEYTRYHTLAVHTRRSRPARPLPAGVHIERGGPQHIAAILACLEENGRRTQFSPQWDAGQLFTPHATPGLFPEDFWLAWRGDRLAGCLAVWDQTAFKQTMVRAYHGWLGRARPLINLFSRLTGYPDLPRPNTPFPFCFVSHVAIDHDDPHVFLALLQRAYATVLARKYSYFMLGLDERHPLLPPLKKYYPHIDYVSQLYLARWDADNRSPLDEIDARPTGLEASLL